MAGSYRHCIGKDGHFEFDLIENMGDAHEACEMMFHMIHTLSRGNSRRISDAEYAYYKEVNPTLTRAEFDRINTPDRPTPEEKK